VHIWDEDVSSTHRGCQPAYIQEVIPHIGSVLTDDLEGVAAGAEVVILGNKSASKKAGEISEARAIVIILCILIPRGARGRQELPGMCW